MNFITNQKTLSFKQIKQIVTVRAKMLNNTSDALVEIEKTKTTEDFLTVFKKYPYTILTTELMRSEELDEWFSKEEREKHHIYTSGRHDLSVQPGQKIDILLLANSQATIKTWENSQATIKTRENSQATIETRANSQATIETRANSQATIETWENSQATIETWENSQATIETRANSQATTNCIGGSLKDVTKKKFFIKKSDFEIVLI